MNKNNFSLFFLVIFSISIFSFLIVESFAQEKSVIPPRKQWKDVSEINKLLCKEGLLLLQKTNSAPACVSPASYLRLVDRGYGMFDPQIMVNRPIMMNNLIEKMISDQRIMNHWHELLINNKTIMKKTMEDWISQMKNNPKLLTNLMGPATSNPNLRGKMIESMKQHEPMMISLQTHPKWMDSVHQEIRDSGMDPRMGIGTEHSKDKHYSNCQWCPQYEFYEIPEGGKEFSHKDRIMDMMHHLWINEEMTKDVHNIMIENPSHMAQLTHQMMDPILGLMMDDPDLRKQMIELMLENQNFMNSIRHENQLSN